ncbi:MAG: outer membrane beta-barrel protein [Gemmatimonadetes bacterium]|nr:outer membrane beta-barrel protein [Gemmatimonadota bacterium]
MRRLLLALTFLPVPLLAQVAERPIRLVVSGGLQLPTGSFADYHDYGVHADVGLQLNAGGLRLRPELSYSRFGFKELTDIIDGLGGAPGGAARGVRRDAYSDAVTTLLGGFANIELPLGNGRVQPFVLGGVGAVKVESDPTTATASFSDMNASLNLGVGLRLRLGGISGLIEARFNNVPFGDTQTYLKDLRTIPVTFGLVF